MSKNSASPSTDLKTSSHIGYRFFAKIGRWCVRFRWLVLAIWLVGTVIIASSLPSLTSVTQSNNSDFLPSSSPTEKALKLESAFQPTNVTTIPVIVANNSGPLTDIDQSSISRLATNLSHVEAAERVLNRGRSPNNQAAVIEVEVSDSRANTDPTTLIKNLRSAISSSNLPGDLSAHLTGPLAIEVDNANKNGNTNKDLEIGTALFIIALLVLIFRAPLAPLITLIPPLLVVFAAGPLIAEAAKHGLKVSSLAQLLLTVLVLGAGTDYGLFLIFRVREEVQGGLDHRAAIVKALSRVGESISFSAATVIAALLSLLVATFEIYSNLGLPLAIGVALMLLAGLTLLPALLAIFGRAVFWPTKPNRASGRRYGIWGRLCGRVVQKPVPVLAAGVLVFVVLALFVPGYKAGGFGGSTSAPADSDSAAGQTLLSKYFPSNNSNPTEILLVFSDSIWQNPGQLTAVDQLLNQSSEFNNITGPLNPNGTELSPGKISQLYKTLGLPSLLPAKEPTSLSVSPQLYQVYRSVAGYVAANGHTVQYAVGLTAGDPGSTPAISATTAIRSRVNQIAKDTGAINSGVFGESAAFYDINHISNNDLIHVIPVAVLVIGILLGILMRSLIAPLYLVISVVLSYLAALGIAIIIFIHIAGNSGIVFILPFLMFIFLLALGEDYNILVMTRIREEAHGLKLKQAVTQALNTTGTTVTSAGLVLAGTFTVLGIVAHGDSQVQQIGFGLAIGILMDTFLVRTLLVPATVVLLGRWNWWPTKHGTWVEE